MNESFGENMKYKTSRVDGYRQEYHIKEGTAYIAFATMNGAGFRVDKVKKEILL